MGAPASLRAIMSGPSIFTTTIGRTHAWPRWAKYAAACGVVAAVLPLAFALRSLVPPDYIYLPFLLAILVAGSLFDHGSGFVATALSALLAAWFFLPPIGSPVVHEQHDGLALVLFVTVGTASAAIIEALHRAVVREKRARAEFMRSEQQRRLLLNEFRHRTRNDRIPAD